VQSLLFSNSTVGVEKGMLDHPILEGSTAELFTFLQEVDPEEAARIHPSDRRKIQTRVELYLQTGRPASELYKTQKAEGVNLRCDTLTFWVWSDREVLNERLDRRVDNMIKAGVEEECRELYHLAQQTGASTTSGVFQAIGPFRIS
jgi:tRNA dimethylallyltransferase